MPYTGSNARSGRGSLLKIDVSTTSTPDFQIVPEATAAPITPGTQDEIEVTNMESTAKEYIYGLADRGTLPIDGNYDPANTVLQKLQSYNGLKKKFEYHFTQFATPVKFTFDGIVGAFSINPDLKGVVKYSCPIKITGDLTGPTTIS